MITGMVDDREATIPLMLFGPRGQEQAIDAIIDTGYTASLSLPSALIASLELPWQGTARGTLADGSECLFDVYEAEVLWDGAMRRLLVDEANTDPLLGMSLLRGYELRMEVFPKGKVELTALG